MSVVEIVVWYKCWELEDITMEAKATEMKVEIREEGNAIKGR